MAAIKRSNLKTIKIGVLCLISFVVLGYYLYYNFFWKNFDDKTVHYYSSMSDEEISSMGLVAKILSDSKAESFHGEKLVHLDLKGAPPMVSYLREFFPYIRKLGATGVLIEYEDMFFYKDELEGIRALNAYQPSVLKEILDIAEFNNLSVVPLIQTFGHLEFILKLEKYKDMRELYEYPQALCPSHERVLLLIRKMIDQVLEAHPKAKYIHIGCDEVIYLGQCNKCKSVMRDNFWTTAELFLNHVTNVAMYINETYPGVRPILWGDMISKFNERVLKKSKISNLVDLMVWTYIPQVSYYITEELLEMYSRVFKTIWITTAFKGATGASQIRTDVKHHLANHISWLKIVQRWKDRINFKGITLTGWQRYDHFAELCELLPLAIPSLTSSLYYLNNAETGITENDIIKILQCSPLNGLSLFSFGYSLTLGQCNFPGFQVYDLINRFYEVRLKLKTHFSVVSEGWLSIHNILHKFTSPAFLHNMLYKWPLNEYRMEILRLEKELKKALSEIYDKFTVEEWITNHVAPVRLRLEAFYRVKEILLEQKVWPRRPFLNNTDDLERAAREICTSDKNFGCALVLI